MLFHAFRVVYTVKELDSHAKHGQSFKKQFGRITEYFCAINLTSRFVQVSERFFFDHGSSWRKRVWNSLYGHFSQKNAPVHASTRARARASPSALHWTPSGRMFLNKCVFGYEGKITLFSFPKNPALREQWMQFVFSGQQRSFSSVFVDERFINKAQFDAWILILKDGAVPDIKDPSHDSELQTVSETASNVSVLLAIGAQVLVTL